MKTINKMFTVALLLTNSIFAHAQIIIEQGETSYSREHATLGSYSCNIISEKSTQEIALIKEFAAVARNLSDSEIFRSLTAKYVYLVNAGRIAPGDPKMQANAIWETLTFARKNRMTTNQADGLVNEFINPGSQENCTKYSGLLTRIQFYMALRSAQ